MYHPWELERRKYAEVGKSPLKSNVNLNCYSDLKTNAATIFYSLDCVVFVNCRYIIVVIISSPHHHNHHHHIIIITNVNIIIILLWCNNRRRSSKLPSMKEQIRNLENGPLATTIFCILDRVFSVGILSGYANSGKYVFTIIL